MKRLHIKVEANRLRRWMVTLSEGLKADRQLQVFFEIVRQETAVSSAFKTLLWFEKKVLWYNRPTPMDVVDHADLSLEIAGDEVPDAVLDLTTRTSLQSSVRTMRPLFNGMLGEEGLATCLLQEGTPEITLVEVDNYRGVTHGYASLEAAQGIIGAMEAVYSRVWLLLEKQLNGLVSSAHGQPAEEAFQVKYFDVAKAGAKHLALLAPRALYSMSCYPSHWRVGWRFIGEEGVFERQSLGGEKWHVLDHPIDHFYADPFPIEWQGKLYLFFEDFSHRKGKGVITVVPFDSEGPIGPPEVVLEEPWHLSYPFLLSYDGAIWMVPESSNNREVSIYRAVVFPYKWEKHATLLEGVEVSDATLHCHNGTWWLFAVTRDGVGGYSDTLRLYHAQTPLGPFAAHPENPVLIDDKTARPAGNLFWHKNRLWRPFQNCRKSYGAALGFAEVTRLDKEAFEQKVETVLEPRAPSWPGRKFHTYNRVGRFEVIDGCIYRPKSPLLARWFDRYFQPR